MHPLPDTADWHERVYGDLLPKLLEDTGAPRNPVRDRFCDIRGAFRYVDNHIRDGKLTDLWSAPNSCTGGCGRRRSDEHGLDAWRG